MPYTLFCPDCSARMKTAEPVPAGSLVECPKCLKHFTTQFDSPERGTAIPPPAKPSRSRPAPPETGDRSDEGDDEPVKPRGKKRPAERIEDEEDDRPRRGNKRRIDDVDGDADSAAPMKKASIRTLVSLALLLILVAGGAAYGVYAVFFSGGPSSDLLAWAPSDANHISGVNVSKARDYPDFWRTSGLNLQRWRQEIGLDEEDVAEMMIARKIKSSVFVFRMNSKIDTEKLFKKPGITEQSVAGKTYHRFYNQCVHVPSAKIFVVCDEKTMTELLQKEQTVTLSAEMKSLLGRTSGDVWQARAQPNLDGLTDMLAAELGVPKLLREETRIGWSSQRFRQVTEFNNEADAKKWETRLNNRAEEWQRGRPPEKKFKSFEISVSGNTVTCTGEAGHDEHMESFFNGVI